MARLDEYQRRRKFASTPEPKGADSRPNSGTRFVVHEHHARALHWDLRLERDGALASWAVPKGIPFEPHVRRLAKRTEDHPEEYLDFEGEIPEGDYGAGRMSIWDSGSYECEKWQEDEVLITFHGQRVQGRYVVVRTKDQDWLLQRLDPASDPIRTPPPEGGPMLAVTGPELPRGPDWCYELKWDGIRCLAHVEGGRPKLASRLGNDITAQYPELRALAAALGSTEVLLDGEIVAIDAAGRPDFHRLQERMHVTGERRIHQLTAEVPVTYVVFDLLWEDGHDLTARPLQERRGQLEDLDLDGTRAGLNWQLSPQRDDPESLLKVAEQFDLEGLMAKRNDSAYFPGRRSSAWRKFRRLKQQEFVVGGWMPGEGSRSSTIGSLLVGFYEGEKLHFAGRVGSGIADADLTMLREVLNLLERGTTPFRGSGLPKNANWVEPQVVVEVRFTEWTPSGRLRHPIYLGLRNDIDPRSVRRE